MRKTLILIPTVAALLGGGCLKEDAPTVSNDDAVEVRFSQAVLEAELEAKKRVALLIVEEAVHGFKLLHAERRFPKSLDEVVEQGMINSLPELPSGYYFLYDPEAGRVELGEFGANGATAPKPVE